MKKAAKMETSVFPFDEVLGGKKKEKQNDLERGRYLNRNRVRKC